MSQLAPEDSVKINDSAANSFLYEPQAFELIYSEQLENSDYAKSINYILAKPYSGNKKNKYWWSGW